MAASLDHIIPAEDIDLNLKTDQYVRADSNITMANGISIISVPKTEIQVDSPMERTVELTFPGDTPPVHHKNVNRSQSTVNRKQWKQEMMERHLRGGVASLKIKTENKKRTNLKRYNNVDEEDKTDQPEENTKVMYTGNEVSTGETNWSLRTKSVKFEGGHDRKTEETDNEDIEKLSVKETATDCLSVSSNSSSHAGNYRDSDIDEVLGDNEKEEASGKDDNALNWQTVKDSDTESKSDQKVRQVSRNKGMLIFGPSVNSHSRRNSTADIVSPTTGSNVKRHTSMLANQELKKIKRKSSVTKFCGNIRKKIDKAVSRHSEQKYSDVGTMYKNPFLYDTDQLSPDVMYANNPFSNGVLDSNNPFPSDIESEYNNLYKGNIDNQYKERNMSQTNPFADLHDSPNVTQDVLVNPSVFLNPDISYDYDIVEEQTKTVKPDGEVTVTTRICRKSVNPFSAEPVNAIDTSSSSSDLRRQWRKYGRVVTFGGYQRNSGESLISTGETRRSSTYPAVYI